MIIQNAHIYTPAHRFEKGDLYIRDGRIAAPGRALPGEEIIDAAGLYALPGLVDLHLHGAAGCDVSDADAAGLQKIADYEAARGVLGFCPAVMTGPEARLSAALSVAVAHENGRGADLLGLRLEGPFLNPARAGAQNRADLVGCDAALLRRLAKAAGGRLRIVDLAPELPGAVELIQEMQGALRFSLGHTEADYATALSALRAGARQLTHCYNAMPGVGHRAPGPVPAAWDGGADVELIADGVHLHPATVRCTFALFGAERVILVSDSMRATGLPDGQYTLGGQDVTVSGGRAALTRRPETIAGSVTDLYECMRRAVLDMGVPLPDAVRAAAENPARALGAASDYGSLAVGAFGNVLLADEALELQGVIQKGRLLWRNGTPT